MRCGLFGQLSAKRDFIALATPRAFLETWEPWVQSSLSARRHQLGEAWQQAFPERDDVTLTIKDFGAASVYRNADREPLRDYVASARLPRVELIEDELSPAQLIELYRSCDVLVHPYRGEGFAMPVLEAMACGLPVIVTAGGPTDEFCPPDAGWRIRSRRCIRSMRPTWIGPSLLRRKRTG